MDEILENRKAELFFQQTLKCIILPVLSPLFFLLAVIYLCLHPKR
jgi:hypothetical protein